MQTAALTELAALQPYRTSGPLVTKHQHRPNRMAFRNCAPKNSQKHNPRPISSRETQKIWWSLDMRFLRYACKETCRHGPTDRHGHQSHSQHIYSKFPTAAGGVKNSRLTGLLTTVACSRVIKNQCTCIDACIDDQNNTNWDFSLLCCRPTVWLSDPALKSLGESVLQLERQSDRATRYSVAW